MKTMKRWVPWLIFAVFAADIVAILIPKQAQPGTFAVVDFGRLPVVLDGRVQPLDSVARNTLRQIRGTQDVPLEIVPAWQFWHHPKKLRSSDWILEAMSRPDDADNRAIFLIHHPELLSELKIEDKGIERSGLRYYTFNDLRPCLAVVQQQVGQLLQNEKQNNLDPQTRTPLQKQLMKLNHALGLYHGIKNSLKLEENADFLAELDKLEKAATTVLPAGLRAAKAKQAGQPYDEAELQRFLVIAEPFANLSEVSYVLLVPPLDSHQREAWATMGNSLMEAVREGGPISPAAKYYASMASAYLNGDVSRFNESVTGYRQWLARNDLGSELNKGASEFYFNGMQPFLHSMIVYICAFLLAVGTLLGISLWPAAAEAMRRSALYLIILAFVVHTTGLIFRMVLEGRPPVTNLYSSAIFIGWGAVVLGVVLERFFKLGLGLAVGSFAGFITLIIAQNLALGGDTMEMMRAVLDTNFWLATHVVVVTLGYASTFVAGLLALGYVILGLLTPLLQRKVGDVEQVALVAATLPMGTIGVAAGVVAAKVAKRQGLTIGQALNKMVYAIICFATLFSFTGTVLGGIWADQSWGRFWGWDPKENGALIIVLWNALILHARWGGLIKERGLMNLAIFGNIVTAFSWFGVNMLGIGLHSYGFMDAAFKWLMIFNATQCLLIALGLLPERYWRSFRSLSTALPSPTPQPVPVGK